MLNPEEDEYEESVRSSSHHHQSPQSTRPRRSESTGSETSEELVQKHVLSPRLVEAISQTAQVVWATTKKQEGLLGRSDVRLQTAVGMPVAMDNQGNMCVVVMFSPNQIQSTDDAMDYLYSISQSATSSSIPCLLPVFKGDNQLKQLEQGNPETTNVSKPLVQYTNHHHTSNNSNNGNSNNTSNAVGFGEGVSAHFVPLQFQDTIQNQNNSNSLQEAPKDTFGIPMLPAFAQLDEQEDDAFDEATYGIWNTIMEINPNEEIHKMDPLAEEPTDEPMALPTEAITDSLNITTQPLSPSMVDSGRKERLVEFCLAFLGMSVFDLADVWVPQQQHLQQSSSTTTLGHLVSVANNADAQHLKAFCQASEHNTVQSWSGAIGRAYATGNPVWSCKEDVFMDSNRKGAFQAAQFRTVLAVPVFSQKTLPPRTPACVVAAYASVQSGSVPFVLRFVQQALRLLWDQETDPSQEGGSNHILFNSPPSASVSHSDKAVGDVPAVPANVQVRPADLGEMAADLEMHQHFSRRKRSHSVFEEKRVDAQQQAWQQAQPNEITGAPVAQNGWTPVVHPIQTANQYENTTASTSMNGQAPAADTETTDLSNQLSSIELPNGDVVTIPLHALDAASNPVETFYSPEEEHGPGSQQTASTVDEELDALQSFEYDGANDQAAALAAAIPSQEDHVGVTTNSTGSKRAHRTMPRNGASFSSNQSTGSSSIASHTSFNAPVPLAMPQALPTGLVHASPSGSNKPISTAMNGHNMPQSQQHQPQSQQPLSQPETPIMAALFLQTNQQYAQQPQQQQQNMPFAEDDFAPTPVTSGSMQMASPDFAASNAFCIPLGQQPQQQSVNGMMMGANGGMATGNGGFQMGSAPPAAAGQKLCRIQGCSAAAISKRPYCVNHSGNRQCEHQGCTKCAQGSTRFCIAHGGGRRCTFPGCDKGARDKFFCAAHGGGKRCQFEGCSKSAVGGSNLCTAHGGGRRCSVPGCGKSAQSSTKYCVKHGGGKKCAHEGCEKVARGRTNFCAAHGGGVRCKLEGCNRVAIGKMQLCRAHGGGSSRGKMTATSTSTVAGIMMQQQPPQQQPTLQQAQFQQAQQLQAQQQMAFGMASR